jgi:hypothetical protein
MPCVLGQALDMKAIHGSNAKTDSIDAQQLAVLLPGGLLPQAYVYPSARRATRDRLRRRIHCMRKRAAWLPHVRHTNRQYHLPEIGKKMASKANRDGVAARCPHPAVQQRIDVDLALMGPSDHLLCAVELSVLKTAQQPEATTLSLRRTVTGIGELLSLVLL